MQHKRHTLRRTKSNVIYPLFFQPDAAKWDKFNIYYVTEYHQHEWWHDVCCTFKLYKEGEGGRGERRFKFKDETGMSACRGGRGGLWRDGGGGIILRGCLFCHCATYLRAVSLAFLFHQLIKIHVAIIDLIVSVIKSVFVRQTDTCPALACYYAIAQLCQYSCRTWILRILQVRWCVILKRPSINPEFT